MIASGSAVAIQLQFTTAICDKKFRCARPAREVAIVKIVEKTLRPCHALAQQHREEKDVCSHELVQTRKLRNRLHCRTMAP